MTTVPFHPTCARRWSTLSSSVSWAKTCGKKIIRLNLGYACDDLARIAIQVITALRALHEIGYSHCDIKPNNLASSRAGTADAGTIYILDLGSARSWRAWRPWHINDPAGPNHRFVAACAHRGYGTGGRKGDLEALAYTLAWLATGVLPWDVVQYWTCAVQARDEMARMKETVSPECLFLGLHPVFSRFYEEVRRTARNQKPRYAYILAMFESALGEMTA